MSRSRLIQCLAVGALLIIITACGVESTPEPTTVPTTFPTAPPEAAVDLATEYVDAWAAGDYAAMYATLDPILHERYTMERFTELHAAFADMARVEELRGTTGEARLVALLPEARPADFPAPTPTARPSADPSASAASSADSSSEPNPAPDPDAILAGPVPAMAVPLQISVLSERFGDLDLERALTMVRGRDGWLIRWSPSVMFSELGDEGTLRLDRSLGARGRIVGTDGTVWAETRDDGVRVYPQEAIGGQVIGYVGTVTAEDLDTLAVAGYRPEDLVGRSGLEYGAEALLRGSPGWTLVAESPDAGDSILAETMMVPGADISITLRPDIQVAAQEVLEPYDVAATAVVDPSSGDVWALASEPVFNPNSMTLGTTFAGEALTPAGAGQIFNKAVLGAYPAGSSFKPFTLVAALQTGVATPATQVTCPPTWDYGEFTFRNYLEHTLPGRVSLAEAMAFSCNTTYMPLSLEVYEEDETALTELLHEFGFGAPTGITYLVEETGIVPDDAWLSANGRGAYSGFEQVQLSIGQGAFLGTPLQLANAYAAIGNGGTLWTPRILVTAALPDGTLVEEIEPTVAQEISVSPADLAYVTDTLEAVTTLSFGTGTAAFVGFEIPVAGKSGTAETGSPDPHAWFPAYAPADAPTISVATILPNIALGTGGTDAAPLVRRVMAAHFAN
ncbi:MAG: penicillin-binding transpeptidase domain-containing protein [Chloroflexota bacterium]|nr:penicillin-binding transpeptidase domain-containing protein [Chloroflexota bacterium]